MRNYIECKICCAKCGAPLEIKMRSEVNDNVAHRYLENESADPHGGSDYGRTGAEKSRYAIFVETCRYCQEELERPARLLMKGISEMQEASKRMESQK